LARVGEIVEQLDSEADRLFALWEGQHRVAIKELSDERRAAYEELRALAGVPARADIQRPDVRIEATEDLAGNVLSTAGKHLLSDESGQFPTGGLLGWEKSVLEAELERCVAWYRNPSRASADALAVAYRDAHGAWRRLCPDFVFFQEIHGQIRPSIVDPHGTHLSDALPKLRGLADFAEEFGASFHRIEAVARVDDTMRVLDLTRSDVRDAVASADSADGLYRSPYAANL
jgi:hypothetical protein